MWSAIFIIHSCLLVFSLLLAVLASPRSNLLQFQTLFRCHPGNANFPYFWHCFYVLVKRCYAERQEDACYLLAIRDYDLLDGICRSNHALGTYFTPGGKLDLWRCAPLPCEPPLSAGSSTSDNASSDLSLRAVTTSQVFDLCESVQICRIFSAGFCKDRCTESWRSIQICKIFTKCADFLEDFCRNVFLQHLRNQYSIFLDFFNYFIEYFSWPRVS